MMQGIRQPFAVDLGGGGIFDGNHLPLSYTLQ